MRTRALLQYKGHIYIRPVSNRVCTGPGLDKVVTAARSSRMHSRSPGYNSSNELIRIMRLGIWNGFEIGNLGCRLHRGICRLLSISFDY